MRNILFALTVTLSLIGCGLDNSYFLSRNYERDSTQTATIGNPMISTTLEYKNNIYHNTLDKFTAELIYSGKSANVIKVVYREYSKDLARPAFTQELQYDLNESQQLMFRSTKIDVISATNQQIVYKVREHPTFKYRTGKLSNEEVRQMKEEGDTAK